MMSYQWKDTRTPAVPCPACGHNLDAASSSSGETPKPGDISVCISCASALVFGDGLIPRLMTASELRELDDKTAAELRLYQRAVRALDRRGWRVL